MVSNTVENIAIGAGSAAATYAAVEAWRRASERTVLDGKTVRSTRVDAARLSADADTFQFKSGGDRSGVTDRLAGVKTWNAAAAGKVMVYEYADGRQVIADGHQRTGLAKRLMSDGHAPIKMDALVLREADGWSPRDVRAYAAIKNMHESSGNALDMAKIMRERPDLVTSSLPMSDAKVREASALSRLSDKAFGMVVGGGVEPGAAAAVGEAVKDATRHADMIAEMSEAKVRGAQHARLYVQQALSAPSVAETTSSLFGEETHTRSLIKERSAVLDRALTSLKSNRKLFGMLEREADTIEAAGNKLARQANSSNADTAGRLSALVEKLATQRGNVSKMLDDAARAVASGEPAAKAGRAFLKSVQGAMEQGGIRALVGDAPLPMAASGGMQRMVAKTVQVPGEISQYVVDTDTGTVKQIKTSRGSGSSIVQDISGTPKGRAVLEYTKKQGGGSSGGMQRMVEKPTWSQRAREIGGDVLDRISALSPKDQKRVVAEYTGVHAKSAKEALKVLDNRLGGWEADSYTHVATNNNEGTAEPLRANRMREETRARLAGIVDQKVGSSSLTGQSSFLPSPTTKEQVTAAAKTAGKPGVMQQDVGGLFGDGMKQMDLVDEARSAKHADAKRVADAVIETGKAIREHGAYSPQAQAAEAKVHAVNAEMAQKYPGMNPGWSDSAREASAEVRAAGNDTAKWLADRDERIRQSKAAGTTHLDGLPRAVEGMRGVAFHNVHDPRERGVVRTVANTGEVVVDWADEYSAKKNLAETVKEGKKTVARSWLAPTDLKDYAVGQGTASATASTKGSRKAKRVADMTPSNPNYVPGVGTIQEKYWTAKSGPTPTVHELPAGAFAGTQREFESLSPGMRREIKRTADKMAADAVKQPSAPPGWSDAAREGSAKSRGVALPGEAKPVVPVKAGKAKGAPKPTAKGAKILDLYHGTAAPKFDTFKSGNSDGMRGGAPYLTSDYKAAERYAKMAAERTGGTPRVLRVQVEAEKVMSTGSNWMKQSQISGLMKRVLGREVGMKAFDDFARTSVTGPPGNKGAQGATVYKSLADAVGGANALNERLAKAGVTAVKFDQPAAFWGNTSYNIRDAVAVLDPSRARIVDQDYRPAPKAKAPSAAPKAPKAPPVAQLRADAAKAGIPAAAQMKKPELMSLKKAGKFMGPLAIIGAGAVAFDATRNQAHAAGKSESAANLDAAGAAAIASGSVAAIGYGIGKVVQAAARVAPVAGKVLSRAVPAVAIAAAGYEIGKGAVAGFKKDGLAGAAKGAGVGAMDFATLGAYSHFANKGQMGRLTPEQEAQFASADQGYRAGQEQQKAAAATTDDGSGWTDQARIAAYMKRIANAGGTPQNMPYGGKPRQQPASSGTWAQASVSVPSGPAKGGK